MGERLFAIWGAVVLMFAAFVYLVRRWCPRCNRPSCRTVILEPSGIAVWRCKQCAGEWVKW